MERSLGGIILYEKVSNKSDDASLSLREGSFLVRALNMLNERYSELVTIPDLNVCQYTSDSHCRIKGDDGENSDKKTSDHLLKQAELYIAAGAKGLMPSGMIPRFSHSLRSYLNSKNYTLPQIISQSAKFNSSLYSPFRSSLEMKKQVDKSAYQLAENDISSAINALQAEDNDGADIALIKPAITYLDLFSEAKDSVTTPLGGFITSGEHSMLIHASGDRTALHSSVSALNELGAEVIVTYLAPELAGEME